MIHVIGLKENIPYKVLPNEVKKVLNLLFPEQSASDFEVFFKFGSIKDGENFKLFVPFKNKFYSFSNNFFDVKSTYDDKNHENRYNGEFYKTEEGKEWMKDIIKRYNQVNEVTSTGSVGGSFETPFLVSPNDMKDLEALKRNPQNIYTESNMEIVKEIKISELKQMMVEKFVYNSDAAKTSSKNTSEGTSKKSGSKDIKDVKNKPVKKDNPLVDKVNRRRSDDQKIEAHQNGQTDIRYDYASEKALEQNEENIKFGDGDKAAANRPTEEYADPNLGQKMIDDAKARIKSKQDKEQGLAGFSIGGDFEFNPNIKPIKKPTGFKEGKDKNGNIISEKQESKTIKDKNHREKDGFYFYDKDGNYLSYSRNKNSAVDLAKRSKNKKIATHSIEVKNGKETKHDHTIILKRTGILKENKMKKYIFKKEIFENADYAASKIPTIAKKSGNIFLMEDKEKNIVKVEWKGNESTGTPTLLESKFPTKEAKDKMIFERMANYKTEDNLGGTNLNEDQQFFDMLNGLR